MPSKYGDYNQFMPKPPDRPPMDLGGHVQEPEAANRLREQTAYNINIYDWPKRAAAMIEIIYDPMSNLEYNRKQAERLINKLLKVNRFDLIGDIETALNDPDLMAKRARGLPAKLALKYMLRMRLNDD
jgi:hypothetical protein